MKTLLDNELYERIHKSWEIDCPDFKPELYFQSVLGGTIIHTSDTIVDDFHQVSFIIIKDPEYRVNNEQLCAIQDEGNHCISKGSITYEENYAYITWSNLGHI